MSGKVPGRQKHILHSLNVRILAAGELFQLFSGMGTLLDTEGEEDPFPRKEVH